MKFLNRAPIWLGLVAIWAAGSVAASDDVLRGAAPSKDHKCGDVGSITLQYGEGDAVVLGVLPGHDDTVYQYRLYRGEGYTIHQVDRKEILAALKELGCPVDDPGFPE